MSSYPVAAERVVEVVVVVVAIRSLPPRPVQMVATDLVPETRVDMRNDALALAVIALSGLGTVLPASPLSCMPRSLSFCASPLFCMPRSLSVCASLFSFYAA
jgi:hypothetical protein